MCIERDTKGRKGTIILTAKFYDWEEKKNRDEVQKE